jgi:hypothetical protein
MITDSSKWKLLSNNFLPFYIDKIQIRICTSPKNNDIELSITDVSRVLNVLRKKYVEHDQIDTTQLDKLFRNDKVIHIIIQQKGVNDNDDSIIGHLCFHYSMYEKFIIIKLIRLFNNPLISPRNKIGSLMLSLCQEISYSTHKKILMVQVGFSIKQQDSLQKKIKQKQFVNFLISNLFHKKKIK